MVIIVIKINYNLKTPDYFGDVLQMRASLEKGFFQNC